MDISEAAVFFDNDPVRDGYTDAYLFDGQVASYDDSSSDGATVRRRVMSAAPTVALPTRKVVSIYGDRWLAGRGTADGFQGATVRQHFNMKRVTDLVSVLTPEEARAEASGTLAYVHKLFLKDTVNSMTDSEYDCQFNVFIAPGETARKGSFLRDTEGRLYRVRNDYLPADEVRVLESDQLDIDALVTATFNTGTYDPATDTVSAGTTTSKIIVLDTPKFYRFRHVSDDRIKPGDMTMFAASSLNCQPGTEFEIAGVKWEVLTVQPEIDLLAIHARMA